MKARRDRLSDYKNEKGPAPVDAEPELDSLIQ